MHRTVLVRIVAFITLMVISVWPSLADPGASRQYHFLRLADYEAITGCDGSDYLLPIQSAIHFLAFAGSNGDKRNNGLQYARRHTKPLFRSLLNRYPGHDGAVASRCIPPSLRQIGFALRLLDADGGYGKTRLPKQGFAYDPALLNVGKIDPRAFPVVSRAAYIARTGCTVTPSSYNKYRIAFEWVVLRLFYEDRARDRMIEFLANLSVSRPTSEGFVDQQCMIPAISRVASQLGLLDEKGRYRARQ